MIVAVTCFIFCSGARLSGGDVVLVRESVRDLFSGDLVLGEVDLRWPGVSLSWCELARRTVRPGCVVVLQVFGQYSPQMVLVDDQQPVEEFPAQVPVILPQMAFVSSACGGLART
jgi:hypothetical protein